MQAFQMKRITAILLLSLLPPSLSHAAKPEGFSKFLKGWPRIYYVYDGLDIKKQPDVATIAIRHGMFISIDGRSLSSYPNSGPQGWDTWLVADVMPGHHKIQATFIDKQYKNVS
jgi:hypothetical protein